MLLEKSNITVLCLVGVLLMISASAKPQVISTVAGRNTSAGPIGDGGAATSAAINSPNGGVFDKFGNYYFAEILGHRIRKIDPAGVISTIAGNGTSGYNGDNQPASAATLRNPTSVGVDAEGNIYFSDGGNYRIRKVDVSTGIITTVAGTGSSGYNGDNLPATTAHLGAANDIFVTPNGEVYFADAGNYRIRKVDKSGVIKTVAGSGGFTALGTGDDGPALAATFNYVSGVVVDKKGTIYISDWNAGKIRRIDESGVITTIAGDGNVTYAGDHIPAKNARFNPVRIGVDYWGAIYIADRYNKRVHKIDEHGVFITIAGNGLSGNTGDGGQAIDASIDFPSGIAFDTCNNLYITVCTNIGYVRKIAFNPDCVPMAVNEPMQPAVQGLRMQPNPTTGLVTVTAGVHIHNVVIYNLLGQLVVQHAGSGKQQQQVDVSMLPLGMYIVRVNEVWTARLVKE